MAQQPVYAGIDIGGTSIKFGIVDQSGQVIHKEQRPTQTEKGARPLMHLVTNIAERLMYYAADEDYEVRWLGVGTPGAVDFNTGQVIGPCPNIEGWTGTKIGEILRERLNMPVWVDNDVNAMALAEARFGAARKAKSVVCLTIGTGIGGAIILDGRLYRGANFSAGELGHIVLDIDGPLCSCGNNGCLEALCASQAITDRAKTLMNKGLTPIFEEILDGDLDNLVIKKLFLADKKGDEVAGRVIEETSDYLGTALAGIVNLLNPEVVVIGGGIIEGGGGLLDRVSMKINKAAFSSATKNLKVVKAELGNKAGFIGAGLLGIEKEKED